jgi:hypothetical protein
VNAGALIDIVGLHRNRHGMRGAASGEDHPPAPRRGHGRAGPAPRSAAPGRVLRMTASILWP